MPEATRVDDLARLLIEARNERQALTGVPDELMPADGDQAQLVDDRVAKLTGWPVVGWKIGCTSEHAQQLLGSPGPFSGRVYSIRQSGQTMAADELAGDPMVEGEFAFVLGRNLPPIESGYSTEAVLAAVAAVQPSIELVGGRFAQLVGTPLPLLMADAGSNVGLVLGQPVPVDGVDVAALTSMAASMDIDGEVAGSGTGADVLGDPVEALRWLANHLSGRGIGLEAGQVVSTGTATQIAPLCAGSTATLTIDGLGTATVTLS